MFARIGECGSTESEIGGKAFHLNRLSSKFPVPSGFVLTECSDSDLAEILDKLSSNSLAVRSSAIGEDGMNSSFAGMHSTFLEVPKEIKKIKKAIQKCQQSVNNEFAIKYRLHNITKYIEEIKEENIIPTIKMPVVIQEMIIPKAAGVCFTQNPVTKDKNIIVVEIVEGLGENLVSGHVTPFKFEFIRENLKLSSKSIPNDFQDNENYINEELARKVAELGIQIEKESNEIPQDVEFAFDKNDKLWLLQSRPITTLKNESEDDENENCDHDLLSNRTTREVIPHPMTFMSWSAFFYVIQNGLQARYKKRNIDYNLICKDQENRGFYELRKGYLYQNLTITDQLSRKEFGITYKDSLLKSFNEIPIKLFSKYCDNSKIGFTTQFSGLFGLISYLRKITPTISKTNELIENYRQKFNKFKSWKQTKEKDLNLLYEKFFKIQNEFASFGGVYIESQIYLELLSSIVQALIDSYYAGDKKECFNSLLIGLGDIITHSMNIQLCEIFKEFRNCNQNVFDYFDNQFNISNSFERWICWKDELKDSKEFFSLLCKFFDEFGHRAVCELEVSSPRWGNDPNYIFQLIQLSNNEKNSNFHSLDHQNSVEKRNEMENNLLNSSPFYIRSLFRWCVSKLQEFVRFRENLKDIVVRFISKQQQILLSIEYQWNQIHSFPIGDIFHLSIQQLQKFQANEISFESLIDSVHLNKNLFNGFCEVQNPPKIFIGDKSKKCTTSDAGIEFEGRLKFVGNAGAPGIISGEAIIISSLESVHLLANCKSDTKILVTKVTDPAWTPLFLQVDAVVVETGGVLSHSAIVAREFGIPCVFGIPDLFSHISTGDFIQVDGNSGTIVINKQ